MRDKYAAQVVQIFFVKAEFSSIACPDLSFGGLLSAQDGGKNKA